MQNYFQLFCYELRCFVARIFSVNSYVKFDVTFMSDVITKDILCHYFSFHKIYVKSENEQCGVFCLLLDGVQLNVANIYKYVKSLVFFVSVCLFVSVESVRLVLFMLSAITLSKTLWGKFQQNIH